MVSFIPFLIFLFFFILMFLGIPIAFSMITTGIAFVLFSGMGIDSIIIPFSRLGLGFSFTLLAVFFFIELGNMMNETKISEYIIDFVRHLIGIFIKNGATGAIITLSCAACGPLTGSANGTTSAVGSVMIPQMNKFNYSPKYSATLLAYSGILGSLIPPSISGLIYAVVVNLSVLTVWLAVCGVGFLYMVFLLIINIFLSKKRGYESVTTTFNFKKSKEDIYRSFIKALPALLVPIVVLGSIYAGVSTPTEAGAFGVLASLFLGIFYYKTFNSFKQFFKVLYISSYQTVIVMFLVCASFSLSHALTASGSVKAVARSMLLLSENKYILLLLTEVLVLILGCFLDDTPIMILLAPIASAILIPVGIHPYHLAGVFVFVCLIGLVTPPVGTVLYIASSMSGVVVTSMVKEILIFFIPTVILLLLITFFPSISFFLPKLFGLL